METNLMLSIFMWPDGGKSSKVIDITDERARRNFAKMAHRCNVLNGVVITVGMNPIEDNGFVKLHERLEAMGIPLQQCAVKPTPVARTQHIYGLKKMQKVGFLRSLFNRG